MLDRQFVNILINQSYLISKQMQVEAVRVWKYINVCLTWNTPCPQKKYHFSILAITTSNLHQIQKGRSVLKSASSEDFKTDLTFDIWTSRSWKNWGQRHQGSFSFFTWICKVLSSFSSCNHSSGLSKHQFDILLYFLWYFPHKWPNFYQ